MTSKAFLVALASAALLAGCDDDNDTVTNPPAGDNGGDDGNGTAACTETEVVSEEVMAQQYELVRFPFTTEGDGRVEVMVDWSDPQFNVGAFVVNEDSCSDDDFGTQSCSFLMQSGAEKPRELSGNVPEGDYELLVQNFGDGTGVNESLPLTISVLSTTGTGCPAPSSS